MHSKHSHLRSGFTLVEIMIVVAIIALLAAISVPSFLRARKRAQATATLEYLRVIDGAKDVYAIENQKSGTTTPVAADLLPYIKKNSKLYTDLAAGAAKDALGNSITINAVDTAPQVAATTKTALSDALNNNADGFFGAYK